MATITPIGDGKDRQYRVRAVVGYKANGAPIQKMRTFKRERDAIAWGRAQDTAREQGTVADAGKLTLRECIEAWLARCARRVQQGSLEATTLAGYRKLVQLYVMPDTEEGRARVHVRLDRIKPAHVQAIIDAAPTPHTANRARVMLRMALREAEQLGLIAADPTRRTTAPKHRPKEGQAWTDKQARAFLQVAQHDRYHALWKMWLHAGVRPSELYGLRWSALDLEAATLRIVEARVHLHGETHTKAPKSANSRRPIDLPAIVVVALRAWRAVQAQERLILGEDWAGEDLVFTGDTGRPVDRRSLDRTFKRLCARAGVPKIRLYDVRHTFGTLALEQGSDLKTVAAIMGHDPAVLLRTYQHVRAEHRRQVVQGVASILAGDTHSERAALEGDRSASSGS